MYRLRLKKYILSGRALLLLVVYLLHFVLFQTIVIISFYDSNRVAIKSFFSGTEKKSNPNSGIATFRTLEKHENNHQVFKIFSDYLVTVPKLFSWALLNGKLLDRAHIQLAFHRTDESCRLYLMDCIFRI